jgi:glycosyltransferase involved in cell wall biosynthesis
MNYLNILYILKLFIFIFFCITFNSKKCLINSNSDFYKSKKEKNKALRRGKKFFRNCIKDIFINQTYFKKNINPLVSVVIPVYNAEKKIKRAIKSIQNQNLSNLEIILVNDFSTDKTIDVVRSLQKYDERIILIENKKNRGIFYTRSIGTLKSSGEYIFPLDNDDLFFDEEVLDSIVNEAIKGSFDIVEFKYAEYYNFMIPPNSLITSEFGNHTHNLILHQPELGQFSRKKNNTYGVYDCFLWAKCIKSILYKNCLSKIGKKIYFFYILRGEDFITSFVLFRLANSFKFYGKYGIFRYKNNETATYQSSREIHILSRIIYLDIIIKFTDNNFEDKLYVVDFAKRILRVVKKEFEILNKKNKKYFKSVFHKLLANKYIKNKNKKYFISIFQNFSLN